MRQRLGLIDKHVLPNQHEVLFGQDGMAGPMYARGVAACFGYHIQYA